MDKIKELVVVGKQNKFKKRTKTGDNKTEPTKTEVAKQARAKTVKPKKERKKESNKNKLANPEKKIKKAKK